MNTVYAIFAILCISSQQESVTSCSPVVSKQWFTSLEGCETELINGQSKIEKEGLVYVKESYCVPIKFNKDT